MKNTIACPVNRHDAFSRMIGILDSMGEIWNDAAQVRATVSRIAVWLRDTQASYSSLADYAKTMQVTYAKQSKAWAILGCAQNILNGGKSSSVN